MTPSGSAQAIMVEAGGAIVIRLSPSDSQVVVKRLQPPDPLSPPSALNSAVRAAPSITPTTASLPLLTIVAVHDVPARSLLTALKVATAAPLASSRVNVSPSSVKVAAEVRAVM